MIRLLFLYPLLFVSLSSQQDGTDFEKRIENLSQKWERGAYISLEELEEAFADCPDKKKFPDYFF